MRTATEVIADIAQTNMTRKRLGEELVEIREVCTHGRTEPRSAACCGSWRLWNLCLDCGEEINVTYNNEGC